MPTRGRFVWWMLGTVAALIGGVALLALVVSQLSSAPESTTARTYREFPAVASTPERRDDTDALAGANPLVDASSDEAEAAPPLLAAVDRIRITRIGVDAPVVVLGLDEHGDMDAPDGPEAVGWYEFTSKPGLHEGNAVLSGHVDWRGYGPAVFAELGALEPGDHVEIALVDGSTLRYRVTASRSYAVGALDSRELIAPTAEPSLTLITCEGAFTDGEYDERRIVRAVLVDRMASHEQG